MARHPECISILRDMRVGYIACSAFREEMLAKAVIVYGLDIHDVFRRLEAME
ncbi:hypothetical protein O6R05_02575 [Peptoniphilus equinus]|uniref:DUF1858 domain-containing protein n=1 Tax=Peptoniphilus equinus TaxID=3016343 RepID=A0ABY7QVR4_9FIRM|nr:hypothetical protein [Peptoniphilus equinus]WBW50446.1 hypothetical protein O6R05_02575 [Peptoniphilus equinus]